jgi:hypothetical protein
VSHFFVKTPCSQSGQAAQRPSIAQCFRAIWVFSSYLGVFQLFAVQCCADVHFSVVIRTGVSHE